LTFAPDPVAAELSALKKWKAEQEAAQARTAEERKKADEEAAKKRGEFEQLYTAEKTEKAKLDAELKTLRERESARQKVLGERNEAALKTLPAEIAALAPAGADADTLAGWIERAAKAAGQERPAGGAPRGAPGPGAKVKLTPEQEAEAVRRGLTPEKWAEILSKSGRIKAPVANA